jgi:hypothetical protein
MRRDEWGYFAFGLHILAQVWMNSGVETIPNTDFNTLTEISINRLKVQCESPL